MTKTPSILSVLALAVLAACGGGGGNDDRDAIPADAKVCELKQSTGSNLIPRFDIEVDGLIPGVGQYLLSPRVQVSEDLVFTMDRFFPGMPPKPEDLRYTFYVQEWLYHAGDAPRYQCVLSGLLPDDKVYLVGGKLDTKRLFLVNVRAYVVRSGQTIASQATQLLIDY